MSDRSDTRSSSAGKAKAASIGTGPEEPQGDSDFALSRSRVYAYQHDRIHDYHGTGCRSGEVQCQESSEAWRNELVQPFAERIVG